MYLLFCHKNWHPKDFLNEGPKMRTLIRAFVEEEIEERRKEDSDV